MNRSIALVLLLLVLVPAAVGQEPAAELARIREDLVELRFEEVLDGVEALLRAGVPAEADRAAALILRAEAHVALGRFDSAESDYREILQLAPEYEPDSGLTPRKALARFEKVQAALISRLNVRVTPADARLVVDDRPVRGDKAGTVPLLAGEHRVRAEREGFDPIEETVVLVAGEEQALELRLVPNARSVVLFTEPDDVEVELDGLPVGRTVRAGGPDQPAQLELFNLTLGEHVFGFHKPCYRSQRRIDLLTVDLEDTGPKQYGVIRMMPARATLILSGLEAGEVSVDGRSMGALPAELSDLCPGEHAIEVRRGDRRVWAQAEQLVEGEVREIVVAPRPNVVLVGQADWPRALEPLEGCCSVSRRTDRPTGKLDSPSAWAGAGLPADTDLVLFREREGTPDERWLIFSPPLARIEPLEALPPGTARPDWTAASWGLHLVDSEVGGPARVAEVTPQGPAERAGLAPGDHVLALDGEPAGDSRAARARLGAAALRAGGCEIVWRASGGETRRAQIRPQIGPRLDPASPGANAAVWKTAWAAADAAGSPPGQPAALANLALLLSQHGRHEAAVEIWRRVSWAGRPGLGAGTMAYHLGRDLEAMGRKAQAIEAYRVAATSEARDFDDEGPPIAGAARDRLAELGQDERGGQP